MNTSGSFLVMLAILGLAVPAYAGLGQPNDIAPYGSFELDPVGTAWPTGWDSQLHSGEVGGSADPADRSPDGGQWYGIHYHSMFSKTSGMIDIDVPNPEPDWMEKQIYVGAWVDTWKEEPSYGLTGVRFSMHMDADGVYLLEDLDLYSPWYDTGPTKNTWQWKEWYITEASPGVPLPCLDFNINVEFYATGGVLPTHSWPRVDGIEVQHICVPEPCTLALAPLGLLALVGVARRRRA